MKLSCTVAIIGACALFSAQGAAQEAPPPSTPSPAAETAPPPPPPPPPTYASQPTAAPSGGIRDTSEHRRPFTLSVLAYVPWWYGIGIGVRASFEIPIVHDGFIPALNDSFSLEPSFAFAYSSWNRFSYYDELHALRYTPALAALWSFHFSERFRAYGAVNLGYTLVSYTGDQGGYNFKNWDYFYFEVSAGIFYDFSEHFSVRAEVGWQGLRGGLAVLF